MALFRFHRGSLEVSLKTVVFVENIHDVADAINDDYKDFNKTIKTSCICVIPQGIDERIGWNSHLVTFSFGDELCSECNKELPPNKSKRYVAGYLSEPMESHYMSLSDLELSKYDLMNGVSLCSGCGMPRNIDSSEPKLSFDTWAQKVADKMAENLMYVIRKLKDTENVK